MYDIITVGSATFDVFALTEAELITIRSNNGKDEHIAYPVGTKILIDQLDFQTGGGGTNTAVAFARLGLKTAFLGKVGNDSNGREVLLQLKKENVDFIGVIGKEQTGYSIILDSIEEDRTILTYKGANNELSFREIDKRKLASRWFYFSSMVGKSFKAMESLAEYARDNSIKVAFNPSAYLTKKGPAFISKILRAVEILILNKEEAEMLVGRGQINELAVRLSKLGPKVIVVTDGRNGVCAYDGYNIYRQSANRVKVKETTGAGDAFASGFVAGMVERKGIEYALNLGLANATSVVMHIGAKNKLLDKKEAKQFIRRNNKVQVIRKCSKV